MYIERGSGGVGGCGGVWGCEIEKNERRSRYNRLGYTTAHTYTEGECMCVSAIRQGYNTVQYTV